MPTGIGKSQARDLQGRSSPRRRSSAQDVFRCLPSPVSAHAWCRPNDQLPRGRRRLGPAVLISHGLPDSSTAAGNTTCLSRRCAFRHQDPAAHRRRLSGFLAEFPAVQLRYLLLDRQVSQSASWKRASTLPCVLHSFRIWINRDLCRGRPACSLCRAPVSRRASRRGRQGRGLALAGELVVVGVDGLLHGHSSAPSPRSTVVDQVPFIRVRPEPPSKPDAASRFEPQGRTHRPAR